jgi:hypothetical protein
MEPIPSALSPATRRAATYLPYLSPELVEPRGIEPLTFALRRRRNALPETVSTRHNPADQPISLAPIAADRHRYTLAWLLFGS